MNYNPIAIDLFSGAGGLSLGLKKAGFKVVGAVELDPLAAETYQKNHKHVLMWRNDIRQVSASQILEKLKLQKGELDLLAGCPPCQGFSTMRTLKGSSSVRDKRNDLVFEFLRLTKELEPKAIMLENVPGLALNHRMKTLLKELTKLGYQCECRILDSSDYSVPQRRKRTILLGGRVGPIDFPDAAKKQKCVSDYISNMPRAGKSGDPLHDYPVHHTTRIKNLIKKIPKNGGSRSALGEDVQLKCHKNFGGFKDVYGRMAWDKVAPTITGGCVNPSKGRFLHPIKNRAITLREAALLQTFPRKYFFSLNRGKTSAALLIGNALPPEFIKRISLKILAYLNEHA